MTRPIPTGAAAAASAGHFTTMQLRGGATQGRGLHLARLREASLELYGTAPGVAELRSRIREALAEAGALDGDCSLRVRIRPPDGGPRDAVGMGIGIDIEPPRHPSPLALRVRTQVGPRACAGVKHLALDHQLAARRAARDAGFDDALLATEDGRIAEGTFWNIAFFDGHAVVWPDGPALRGVTQLLLQAALDRAGLAQHSAAVDREALGCFRAAFAMNSTGLQDIAAIDDHAFPGDARIGAMLRTLLDAIPRERF